MTCAICLTDFNQSTAMPIATLGCTHTFHRECLEPWFKQAGTCPTCRANIGTPAELTSIFVQTIGDVAIETADSPCRSISRRCQAKIACAAFSVFFIGVWVFIILELFAKKN